MKPTLRDLKSLLQINGRNSRSQMFFKIDVLKKFRNIHRKTSVLEPLFNNISFLDLYISFFRLLSPLKIIQYQKNKQSSKHWILVSKFFYLSLMIRKGEILSLILQRSNEMWHEDFIYTAKSNRIWGNLLATRKIFLANDNN